MTTPITNATPVKTEAYVQIEGGVQNYGNTQKPDLGAMLGGQISKGGTYANAEVGYGTAFKAKAEIGHEFKLGQKTGIDLSGNAEYVKSNFGSEFSSDCTVNNSGFSKTLSNQTKWHDGLRKAGASVMMAFHGKRGNVKVGAEMGAYSNKAPDVTHTYTVSDDNHNTTEHSSSYLGRRSGSYATPKISAELNLGKNEHWSVKANADKFGGNVGLRYTF